MFLKQRKGASRIQPRAGIRSHDRAGVFIFLDRCSSSCSDEAVPAEWCLVVDNHLRLVEYGRLRLDLFSIAPAGFFVPLLP